MSFTAPNLSSFGGLTLLKSINESQNFIHCLSTHVREWRNENLLVHGIEEMMTQRIFQIASDYEDADDCDALRNDSMLKMCSGRLPDDVALSSQPTMTRFENHVHHRELYEMGREFVLQFIRSYKKAPVKIILDFDDSNSNTYGVQEQTLFNDYYGEYCYMPLFIFEGYSGKLVQPLLRPDRVNKRLNVFGLMKRIITEIRKYWKETIIIVRGDSMFCSHDFMEWSEKQHHVQFITGLAGNMALNRESEQWISQARDDFKRDGKPLKRYYRHTYKAESWNVAQCVITKVE